MIKLWLVFRHNISKGKEIGKSKYILHKVDGVWLICLSEMYMAAMNGKL